MMQDRNQREHAPRPVPVLEPEVTFETCRSGGPGGQNVNKVETKVRLLFDPWLSTALTWEQKGRLARSPEVQRVTNADGLIVVVSQEHRTQLGNKRAAVAKLHDLIERALEEKPERVETKPPPSAKERRLAGKERHSQRRRERSERFDAEG